MLTNSVQAFCRSLVTKFRNALDVGDDRRLMSPNLDRIWEVAGVFEMPKEERDQYICAIISGWRDGITEELKDGEELSSGGFEDVLGESPCSFTRLNVSQLIAG